MADGSAGAGPSVTTRSPISHLRPRLLIGIGAGAVLLLGTFHQGEFGHAARRARSELIPSSAAASDAHTLVLTQDSRGEFTVAGEVNGMAVNFLVDTRASDIVLSPAVAKHLDVDLSALQFAREFRTADGTGHGAPYRVAKLSVGSIALSDVPVTINQTEMMSSLLGKAFLERVGPFEVRGRKLYLHWRI
jgi:aspartyl protease family protein